MFIQVIFKNNIQVEGNLVSNDNNEMVIKSENDLLTTIIPSVSESVAFYQIDHAKDKFYDISSKAEKTDEDLEDLSMIKNNLNISEREKIFKNLRSSIYDDTQKQVATQYSNQKAGGTNSNFASGLRKMFK